MFLEQVQSFPVPSIGLDPAGQAHLNAGGYFDEPLRYLFHFVVVLPGILVGPHVGQGSLFRPETGSSS